MVNSIPGIIQYVVPGFILLSIFSFVSVRKENYGKSFIASVCVSYLLKLSLDCVPNANFGISAQIVCAILIGYFFGRIVASPKFNDFLIFLKIKNAAGSSFWANIVENELWIMIYADDVIHYGGVSLVEDRPDGKYIVLDKYSTLDYDGNVIDDRTNDSEFRMMFDMSQYKKFSLIKQKPKRRVPPKKKP